TERYSSMASSRLPASCSAPASMTRSPRLSGSSRSRLSSSLSLLILRKRHTTTCDSVILRRRQRDLRLECHRRRARRQHPLARHRADAVVERVAERRREVRALELPRRREARLDLQRDRTRLQAGILLERLLVALLDRAARLLDDVEELLGRLADRLVVD